MMERKTPNQGFTLKYNCRYHEYVLFSWKGGVYIFIKINIKLINMQYSSYEKQLIFSVPKVLT